MEYSEFIKTKEYKEIASGFDCGELNPNLKDFQSAIDKWALKRGRAAIFADTGLGKTLMQLVWADEVVKHTNQPVIVFAPLAVARQTVEEGEKFGIKSVYVRSQPDIMPAGIYVTNYEMREYFDPDSFSGVILDESSILKNETGKTRRDFIDQWVVTPYRLSCTATPSPNDFMELGNQAEFLGIMSMTEMLAMFFFNDAGDTGTWKLKAHGEKKFFEWLATWAVFIRMPSDLGFSDEGYILPPLNIIEHEVKTATVTQDTDQGELFVKPAQTLNERRKAKRDSINERVKVAAGLINNSDESWIAWCFLNDEQDELEKAITVDYCSVRGSNTQDQKEERLLGFSHGKYKNIITKGKIAGMGLNWQHSHNAVFVGLDDSFEKFYQSVRRQYRFGQKHPVNIHIVTSDGEESIKKNIERKQDQHDKLSDEMAALMGDIMRREIVGATIEKTDYNPDVDMVLPEWIGL